ncbi:hypothetical protein K3495_g5505 [Podosphaera aphanis]|nr:hypothetical protein K3495_g5505 [Podosphaera aphanis]
MMSQLNRGQYFLITNVSQSTCSTSSSSSDEQAVDLSSHSYELPFIIADEDLTFNGKPLNLLVEEDSRKCLMNLRPKIRGRSRQNDK